MTRLFLDASVLVAAAAAEKGGSALVLEICGHRLAQGIASRLVLLEAERNIRKKFPPHTLTRYHHLLEKTPLQIAPSPSPDEIRIHQAYIHEKDAPVLAAASASGATYLLTLDQRHFMADRLRKARLAIKIVTPGEFLHLLH